MFILAVIAAALSLSMAQGLAGEFFPDKANYTIQCGNVYCVRVYIGDVNNDGKPDILVCAYPKDKTEPSPGSVLIYFQKESAFTFTPDLSLSVDTPVGIVVKDFDGDGKNDIAVNQRRKWLKLYYACDGFKAKKYRNTNMRSSELLDVNLNKSRHEKFAASMLANATWWRIMKNGTVRSTYICRPPKNQSGQVGLGDLNNDGETDLVYPQHGRLLLYYGPFIFCRSSINPNMLLEYFIIDPSKAPVFQPEGEKKESHPVRQNQLHMAEKPVSKSTQSLYYEAYIADFNGDCRMDIAARANDSISFFYQNAPIGFEQVRPVKLKGKFRQLQVDDLNNDGLTDLVTIDRDGNAIRIFLQRKGKGFVGNPNEADQVIKNSGAYQLCLADINLDGKKDLVLAKYSTGSIQVFLNQL